MFQTSVIIFSINSLVLVKTRSFLRFSALKLPDFKKIAKV
jgi:hypothetical protein